MNSKYPKEDLKPHFTANGIIVMKARMVSPGDSDATVYGSLFGTIFEAHDKVCAAGVKVNSLPLVGYGKDAVFMIWRRGREIPDDPAGISYQR